MDIKELKEFVKNFGIEKFKDLDNFYLRELGDLMIIQGNLLKNLSEIGLKKQRIFSEEDFRLSVNQPLKKHFSSN